MNAESENFGNNGMSSQLSGRAVGFSDTDATKLSAAITKQSGESIQLT